MKRLTLTGLAGMAMLSAALGRTDPSYVNNLALIFPPGVPPVIDATSFINNSAFIDNSFASFFNQIPYETANTVTYTNNGVLSLVQGLRLDTFNTHAVTQFYSAADTVYNGPGAVINAGGTNAGPFGFAQQAFEPVCLISATNIINRGTIEVGPSGLLSLQGKNILLFGGLLDMEGFETGDLSGTAGMFDGYWGVGPTPFEYNPVSSFGINSANSPPYWVTNRDYTSMQTSMRLSSPTTYTNTITNAFNILNTDGTNTEYGIDQSIFVLYLQNGDVANITHNVYLPGFGAVEWVWPTTNIVTGFSQTNYLYLIDDLIDITNLVVVTNGTGPASTAFGPTFIPTNYFVFRSPALALGKPATNRLARGLIAPSTNFITSYSAYEAQFDPTTALLFDVTGQTYTNMPGRIEINASDQLDLRSSRIAGLNYLQIASTNNFRQDANTRVLATVMDYNLASTNATLTISNLVAPSVPRLNGFVDVFSVVWTNIPPSITNVTASGLTNIYDYTNGYYITMVDSHLSSAFATSVKSLNLRATNVVISDVFNILSNITIDAYSLTITTNTAGAQTLAGQLTLPIGVVLGANVLPRLQALTNNGTINALNAATFGAPSAPLASFVNGGILVAQGVSIWTTNFQDTGLINSRAGAINVNAGSAVLSNGVLTAVVNNIVLNADNLFITNQVLTAGRSLTIQAANSLSDGGSASHNFWTVGTLGFNLPIEPPIASLLGTTITDNIPSYDFFVPIQWAGRDLGPVAAGYDNNAALGRLILSGGAPSSFEFSSPSGNSALYVDYLELRNYTTNFDANTNLANLIIDPGMKIYYAQLIINGVSWAERLNGKNGGGLNWVPGYAGAFSSTNVMYPGGVTNRLNQALVQSRTLDSNGDGIPNYLDPTPVFVPSQVRLAASITNTPKRAVNLSWSSVPYSTNSVFFKPSLMSTNWQLLATNSSLPTNPFVLGPIGGRQQVQDPVNAGGFYRVRVDAAAP